MIVFYTIASRVGPESNWNVRVINTREEAVALFAFMLNKRPPVYAKEVRLYRCEGNYSNPNDCLLEFTSKLLDSDTVYPFQIGELPQ